MVIRRGEVWWADLREPIGSGPGWRRPVVIVQSEEFNRSNIGTVVVAILTTNLNLAAAPGNVLVPKRQSGLRESSVINVSQVYTVDRRMLRDRLKMLPPIMMAHVDDGLRSVLALPKG